MPDGLLLRVDDRPLQTNATADVDAGQSVIPVEWPGRLPDAGGTIRVLEVAYPYLSIDESAGTVTLATPLTVAVVAGDPIQLELGGAPAIARDADVLLDGADEPITVDVPHGLLALVPVGDETDVYAIPWPVTIDPAYSQLVNVESRPAVLQLAGAVVDDDGTTLDEALEAAGQSGGSGEPTAAPTSSPTPDPYQDSGAVAVRWDSPADPYTHVRMFLAPAIENSDGTGSIDSSITPDAGSLYADDVQPIAKVSTLTLGGAALDPRLHYQVALGAWNEIGDAPVSAWVLCQPAFIAPAVITDTLIAERINARGIAIASSQAGSYPQSFSGTSLPTGWTQTRVTSSGAGGTSTSLIATVENSGTPSGADGSVLKFDPRTYGSGSEGFAYAAVYSDYTVGDFDLLARFQYTAAAGFDVDSNFSIGSRSTNTAAGDGLSERGIWAEFTPGQSRYTVYAGIDEAAGRTYLLDYPVDPDGAGFPAGTWYWLRLTALRGVVKSKTWRDGQPEPTGFQVGASSSLVTSGRTFARGEAYPIDNGKPRPTFWVDSVSVTAYTTGFLVTPDGNGDWKQVLDPIRNRVTATEQRNTQQDSRLTTNEANIAFDGMAIAGLQARLGSDIAPAAITISSGTAGTPTPVASKVNGRSVVRGTYNPPSGWAANTVYTVGQLPPGTYPKDAINRPCSANRVAVNVNGIINTSGVVQIQTGAALPTAVDLSALSGYVCAP